MQCLSSLHLANGREINKIGESPHSVAALQSMAAFPEQNSSCEKSMPRGLYLLLEE